jgi:hypothetical protein
MAQTKKAEATKLITDHIAQAGEAANEKLYGEANYHMLTGIILTLGVIHNDILETLQEINDN